MTRWFYRDVAGIIKFHREKGDEPTATAIAEDLATLFWRDNPRFDYDRFFEACGVARYEDQQ